MAELFRARAASQCGFEKTVALKRILPAFATNADFVEMFLAEAGIAADLHHPNIAQVFDFGEDNGSYYFTMEYVPGYTLGQIVTAGRAADAGLPLGGVIHVISSVAAGLHYAHEHRGHDGTPLDIVHRDVSPSNVMVTLDGNVKLVDFGIAKAASLSPTTRTGSLKGKIAYMSPEQCRGEAVDRRSDVFSLGIILWELTTGRRLFRSGGADFTLLQTVERAEIPRPTEVVPEYSSALEGVVLKALSRDREDRYATALELRVALEDFALQARIPASSTGLGAYMERVFPAGRPSLGAVAGSSPALRCDQATLDRGSAGLGSRRPSVPSRSLPAGTRDLRPTSVLACGLRSYTDSGSKVAPQPKQPWFARWGWAFPLIGIASLATGLYGLAREGAVAAFSMVSVGAPFEANRAGSSGAVPLPTEPPTPAAAPAAPDLVDPARCELASSEVPVGMELSSGAAPKPTPPAAVEPGAEPPEQPAGAVKPTRSRRAGRKRADGRRGPARPRVSASRTIEQHPAVAPVPAASAPPPPRAPATPRPGFLSPSLPQLKPEEAPEVFLSAEGRGSD